MLMGAVALICFYGTDRVGATLTPPDTEADVADWAGIGLQRRCAGKEPRAAPDYFLLLAWSEDLGAGHRILAKRVHTNGLPIGGPETGAHELTGPTGPDGQKGDQRWPVLVPPRDGKKAVVEDQPWPETANGYVVWSEQLPGSTDYDIYGQRISGGGFPTGHPLLLIGGPGDQVQPDVIVTKNEDLLLVWSDDGDDAGDIFGQRLTAALKRRGLPFPIVPGPSASMEPALMFDGENGLLLVWTDDRGGNLDIYGARLTESGLMRGGRSAQFPVVESPENDHLPALIIDPVDNDPRAMILWTHEHATDGADILGQPIKPSGQLEGQPAVVTGGPNDQLGPAVAVDRGHPVTLDCGCAARNQGWITIWIADRPDAVAIEGTEIEMNGRMLLPVRLLQTVY